MSRPASLLWLLWLAGAEVRIGFAVELAAASGEGFSEQWMADERPDDPPTWQGLNRLRSGCLDG